jgi:hypothetical protein
VPGRKIGISHQHYNPGKDLVVDIYAAGPTGNINI